MENIIKEIENIIAGLQLALEDGEITEENLYHDIRSLLNDKVANLIEEEIISGR